MTALRSTTTRSVPSDTSSIDRRSSGAVVMSTSPDDGEDRRGAGRPRAGSRTSFPTSVMLLPWTLNNRCTGRGADSSERFARARSGAGRSLRPAASPLEHDLRALRRPLDRGRVHQRLHDRDAASAIGAARAVAPAAAVANRRAQRLPSSSTLIQTDPASPRYPCSIALLQASLTASRISSASPGPSRRRISHASRRLLKADSSPDLRGARRRT